MSSIKTETKENSAEKSGSNKEQATPVDPREEELKVSNSTLTECVIGDADSVDAGMANMPYPL